MKARMTAVVLALAALANPSAWASNHKRVIITFKSGTSEAARDAALQKLQASELSSIVSNGNSNNEFVAVVAQVEVPPSDPKKSMALDEAPKPEEILKIEDDYKVKWIESAMPSFQATPFNFPSANLGALGLGKFKSTSLALMSDRSEITWGIDRVKAPAAWDATEGAGVRVAIIDTGVDWSHSDLQGKVDGGYSAIADSEKPEAYMDDNGHGTHVAGTIGAKKDGRGVVGVAPKARLYAVKVLNADGSGYLSDVVKGIIWAASNGMQVANMSLGSSMPSDTMHRAIRYAKARGVVIAAAAGNSGGSVGYPAWYPETIAVAASDWNDDIAVFSSRGPEVDFIAPGVAVISTMLGGDYANYSGTSMATPHVAGLAALVTSQGYRGLDGPDGVMAQLKKAARLLPGLQATDQGFGMINAGRLVNPGPPPTVATR